MAQNIEIKARANNVEQQRMLAEELCEKAPETLIQEDTFFTSPQGRLKLREFPQGPAQLIYYNRIDVEGPKLSEYFITTSEDACGLKSVLTKAYGIRQVVKKVRLLYMSGRTRLHFDQVEGLGHFIELEVVLSDQDSLEQGHREARQLMNSLNIANADLIDVAYADLLDQQ